MSVVSGTEVMNLLCVEATFIYLFGCFVSFLLQAVKKVHSLFHGNMAFL